MRQHLELNVTTKRELKKHAGHELHCGEAGVFLTSFEDMKDGKSLGKAHNPITIRCVDCDDTLMEIW